MASAVELLLVSIFLASFSLQGMANIGVAYGRWGDNLPPAAEVVALYKSRGISKMRIYDPLPKVLKSLRQSNIEVMVGIPNKKLQGIAKHNSAAKRWVKKNVLNYYPSVNFTYIAIGNEVTPTPVTVTGNNHSVYAAFVMGALTNVFNAIRDAGLSQKILVSPSIDLTVIDEATNFPPSKARFRNDVLWYMTPILNFLSENRLPILTSVYPYFARLKDPSHISLEYALFKKTSPEFTDPVTKLQYFNLFDAQLDALYFAMEKLLLGTTSNTALKDPYLSPQKKNTIISDIANSESGWSKAGGKKHKEGGNKTGSRRLADEEPDETVSNACTYYQNLIRHVKKGTPRKPGVPIESFLFAMFDENLKEGAETEKHFGLFYPNKTPACSINFRE